MKCRLFLLLCTAWLAGTAGRVVAVTEWSVNQWRAEQGGLPQNTLQALKQSRDGYLWISSWHGLIRFDGVRFTLTNRDKMPALVSDSCGPLTEDANGALWVGTSLGVVRIAGAKAWHYGRSEGIPFTQVTHLVANEQHGVWCGGEGGVARFTGKKFRHYTTADGLAETNVRALWATAEGELAVATINGIFVFDAARDRFVLPEREITPGNRWLPISTRFSPHTNVVVITERDLQHRTAAGWQTLPGSSLTEAAEGRFVAVDQRGGVWFQRRDGPLQHWSDGVIREIRLGENIVPPQINSFCEDNEGNVWLSSHAHGLFRLTPLRVRSHTVRDGLVHDHVLSVTTARDGSIWAGTERGAARYHNGQWEKWVSTAPANSPNELRMRNNITSIWGRRDGSVWAGTWSRALFRWEAGTWTHFGMSTEWVVDHVTGLYEDRDGAMWVGSGGRGVIRMAGDERLWLAPKTGISHGDVTCMLQTRDDAHWFGTKGGGLNRWHAGSMEKFTMRDGLPSDGITVLHEDADGVLWAGTNRGLARREHGRFTTFTTRDGMFDDMVNWLLEDNLGNFWISCNRGIARIRRADINAVATGRAKSFSHVPIGEVDGMASAETNGGSQPAGAMSADGRLWFPTIRGVVEIDPRNWQDNTNPPPVLLEKVSASGETLLPGDSLTLPPGSGRALEFHYTATSLTDPTRIRFRCQLEGHDADWREVGTQRIATYTNLRPGSYRLRVTARNHHGYWNPAGATFAFTIAPHYYETRWFFAACGLLIVSAIGGIHAYHLRVARRFAAQQRQHALELERARIARDLHDNLGAGLSQVALLGELAGQSANPGTPTNESLTQLAEQSRAALRSLNEVVWATSARHDTIAGLLNFLADYAPALLACAQIRCELEFPTPVPGRQLAGETRHQSFLILKEALNNTVRHAHARKVTLAATITATTLEFTLRDDGCGFDSKEAAARERSSGGNGLPNLHARAREIGARLEIISTPGQGTTLRLTVPVS